MDLVLDLTSDVAHGVSRPGAPVTAFLVGVAAGRADDPTVAARDYAGKISKLAEGWGADDERGEPANDQSGARHRRPASASGVLPVERTVSRSCRTPR